MPRYTISGASVAALAAYVKSRGASLAPALKRAGLELKTLNQPECRVSLSASHVVWEAAGNLTRDPDFGLHFAERLDLDSLHVVGHLARTSCTIGEALDRIVEFSRLLHDAGRTEIERRRGKVFLFPGCRGLPAPPTRHVAEFNTASAVALTRMLTCEPKWAPLEVHFEHEAPKNILEHRRFFGVEPRFNQPETVLVFSAADLLKPVREQAPSQLGQYLERYARTLLESLPDREDDLPGQALRVAITSIGQSEITLSDVAKQLGTTSRTLQRHLTAAGTTFSALVDDARLRTAEKYLESPSLPLAEISYLVGFKDPSTFHKAFKRWTGKTPGAFREVLSSPKRGARPSR